MYGMLLMSFYGWMWVAGLTVLAGVVLWKLVPAGIARLQKMVSGGK